MQHAEKKGETIKNLWVIRRVGGLEDIEKASLDIEDVIRRVGGLEVSNLMVVCPACGYPPCRWLRSCCANTVTIHIGYPPCRWLRRQEYINQWRELSYPPCRWLRR